MTTYGVHSATRREQCGIAPRSGRAGLPTAHPALVRHEQPHRPAFEATVCGCTRSICLLVRNGRRTFALATQRPRPSSDRNDRRAINCDVSEALARLKIRAASTGLTLDMMALDVLDRVVRFDRRRINCRSATHDSRAAQPANQAKSLPAVFVLAARSAAKVRSWSATLFDHAELADCRAFRRARLGVPLNRQTRDTARTPGLYPRDDITVIFDRIEVISGALRTPCRSTPGRGETRPGENSSQAHATAWTERVDGMPGVFGSRHRRRRRP
jgi:hypothetical protein